MYDFKEGDYYRWSFKEEYSKGKSHESLYWCRSGIAYFDGNLLCDTYWSNSSNYKIDLDKVDLVFMGNIHDYEKISRHEKQYYNPKDILDISHSNNWISNSLFIRKGASKSKEVMLAKLQEQIEKEEYEIDYHKRNLARLLDKQSELVNNNNLDLNRFYF